MDTTRTQRNERAALATLADAVTLPTLDDGGAALLAHCRALIIRRTPGMNDHDRDDLTQTAGIEAFALMVTGTEALTAARIAAEAVTRRHRTDRHEDPTQPYDPTDPANVDTLDRLAAYRPAQPDAITHTTDADLAADTLASLAREEGTNALAAVETAARRRTGGAFPKALAAMLTEHGEATIRRHAYQRQQANGGALATHDGRHAITARQEARHEAWTARHEARRTGPARQPVPASGPASAVVVTDTTGARFLIWHETETTETTDPTTGEQITERHTITHREPITTEDAARILATTHASAYRATATDRASDALAYAMTPAGAVAKPNTRKQKRGGGIGGPVITRGPALDWSTRTTR